MMEYHGRRLELRMQGESHSPEMRVTVTWLPAGEPAELEPMRALRARRRPGPVSYTHLDVYKRQPLSPPPRRGTMGQENKYFLICKL